MLWRCNGAPLAFIWGVLQGQGEELPAQSRALEILQPPQKENVSTRAPVGTVFWFQHRQLTLSNGLSQTVRTDEVPVIII